MKYLVILCIVTATMSAASIDSAKDSASVTGITYEQFKLDSMRQANDHALHMRTLDDTSSPPIAYMALIIPLAFIVGGFVVLYKKIEASRNLRLAMIERGMDPSLVESRPNESTHKYGALRAGLLLAGVGFGLLMAIFILNNWPYPQFVELIFICLPLFFGGLGLVTYHIVVRRLEVK